MVTLDDLPRYRRAQLLWRWSHQGLDMVERLVREKEGQPCRIDTAPVGTPQGPIAAVPGDDGLLHLARAGDMLCATAPTDNGWEHETHCSWFDRGTGPEDWTSRVSDPWQHEQSLTYTWTVRAVGPAQDPAAADLRARCHYGRVYWPPPPAKTRSIRLLREALVAAFGSDCQLCGIYPGEMVDHDHETGYVRGLLCRFCNCTLEECPHLTGCPKADFMNNPPAAALALLYPAKQEWRPKESTRQRKIAMLGFDPFEGLPRRQP
ncbi:endonuclease domain-containing protein [Streptomyces yangpuensis]|uniref:endonuclease domain-containing protein n=1 Tax=Streptomyces yangpuensis TaxID=1648182 RepID=UPI00364BE404